MKLTLAELKKLHEMDGRDQLGIKVDGQVEIIVRNEDGSIDQVFNKKNLATSLWNDYWMFQWPDLRYLNIFILPNDNYEMNGYRTSARHNYTNNYEVNVFASVNSSTDTWTYTGVLGAPSATRAIRYIGLKDGSGIGGDVNGRVVQNIFAMTKMSSDITQSTVQTLEVVYRVSFSRS